ncbi:hypothetical protein [Anseongella ginsenosidimutans]|uniref:hypothetical protein n=1 Tax=Anseongella ginsenosidimutans TaxID=496056 RepID=UPI001CEF663F|nr:hypothetical protein [Anseongella ginsenosidimutans]
MKIVKFLGGLGNQMFQYAFYLFLKQHFKQVKADITGFAGYSLHNGFELEDVFGIRLQQAGPFAIRLYTPERRDWATRKLRRLYGTKNAWYPEEKEFTYDPLIAVDKHPRYYWGYWQHYDYIKDIEPQLRKNFQFRERLKGENSKLLNEVSGLETVSLHVRRVITWVIPCWELFANRITTGKPLPAWSRSCRTPSLSFSPMTSPGAKSPCH